MEDLEVGRGLDRAIHESLTRLNGVRVIVLWAGIGGRVVGCKGGSVGAWEGIKFIFLNIAQGAILGRDAS